MLYSKHSHRNTNKSYIHPFSAQFYFKQLKSSTKRRIRTTADFQRIIWLFILVQTHASQWRPPFPQRLHTVWRPHTVPRRRQTERVTRPPCAVRTSSFTGTACPCPDSACTPCRPLFLRSRDRAYGHRKGSSRPDTCVLHKQCNPVVVVVQQHRPQCRPTYVRMRRFVVCVVLPSAALSLSVVEENL